MIAVLHAGPDTFVSHETAVAWWGIAGFRLDRVHIAMDAATAGGSTSPMCKFITRL
jgi:hypothetical protein